MIVLFFSFFYDGVALLGELDVSCIEIGLSVISRRYIIFLVGAAQASLIRAFRLGKLRRATYDYCYRHLFFGHPYDWPAIRLRFQLRRTRP